MTERCVRLKKDGQEYADLVPYKKMVERLRELKQQNFRIVLFTARNMRTYGGNLGLINANTAKVLLAWLDKWEIPYDEIIYGKPWAENGLYVDDNAVRPREFLEKSLEELEAQCDSDRLPDTE
ncbi:MAG: hypothetical protein TR69_WS6001001408 [candidate division WS6 bacterium OLB20]|uniref:Uncharacterized protein n=1 Tax=candidate division WS6 bacterium OLB20 TaxID=1617426 RepID=A0A136LVZ4_9BACT|nr:MAG: hypothetical protein TR69_WS6001001408 [candidate division WS6 bacterium OLB20]